MRWLVFLPLLCRGVALAGPGKPVRKPPPPELAPDRLSYFVDAVIADKTGDYDAAISRYRSAADGADHAAIVYNVADLERRSEDYEQALRGYKKYLELAPQAPDRGAVEQLIRELERTPASLVVDGDDLDGVVFVDGKRAGSSPLVTSLANGWHVVDRIGPDSYRHDYVDAKPLLRKHVSSYGSAKGNVVLSTSTTYSGSWRDNEVTYRMHQRFELPPGKYETFFFDAGRGCSKISFTAPATGVVFVFVEAPRDLVRGACTPIKVTTQLVTFPGGGK